MAKSRRWSSRLAAAWRRLIRNQQMALSVLAVVIGQVTPPMAIALIIAGKIANVDQIRVMQANMPFFLGIIVFLLVAIAVPGLATWLPDMLRN